MAGASVPSGVAPKRLLQPGRLVLATHNKGKVREVAALLAGYGLDLVSAGELGLPEPAETETSFIGNASIKALAAARAAQLPALADDSGFSVASLDGAPGVYTADWAQQPDGSRDYQQAMAKVAALAEGHAGRLAWFSCALVLAWPDGHTESFLGEAPGIWVWPPRGPAGFGYDPMFQPEGHAETYGEMSAETKHAISHRARAFAQLAAACLRA